MVGTEMYRGPFFSRIVYHLSSQTRTACIDRPSLDGLRSARCWRVYALCRRSRSARRQPEDIPSLIAKVQAGDLPSHVRLWRAYSGGHGVPKDAKKRLPYLRMVAEQGSIESQWVLSTLYEFGRAGLTIDIMRNPSSGLSKLHSADT